MNRSYLWFVRPRTVFSFHFLLLGHFLIFFFFTMNTFTSITRKKKRRILNKRKKVSSSPQQAPSPACSQRRPGAQFVTRALWYLNQNDPIFADKKTEAQKSDCLCPRLLSQFVMELAQEPRPPGSPALWKGIQSPASSVDSEFPSSRSDQGPMLTSQSSPRKDAVSVSEGVLKISLTLWIYSIILDMPDFKKPIMGTMPSDKV